MSLTMKDMFSIQMTTIATYKYTYTNAAPTGLKMVFVKVFYMYTNRCPNETANRWQPSTTKTRL